jgi:hypothetical protein
MTNQVSDTDEVYYDDRLKFPIILPEHFRLRVEGIPQIPAFPPIPAFPNEIKVKVKLVLNSVLVTGAVIAGVVVLNQFSKNAFMR